MFLNLIMLNFPPDFISSVSSSDLSFAFLPAGCCAGDSEVLPHGPVDAKVNTNVTLKTLLKNPVYAFISWSYSDGEASVNVATVGAEGLKVNEPYQGRAWINATNGNLHLGPLKPDDSGDYGISMISKDGTTVTGETRLEVLGEFFLFFKLKLRRKS